MKEGKDFGEAARLLKLLGHPLRLKIVCGLLSEPANLSRIARDLRVPISTLAQHLSVLRGGGILEGEKQGLEIVFRVVDDRVPGILRVLCHAGHGVGKLPSWSWQELGA